MKNAPHQPMMPPLHDEKFVAVLQQAICATLSDTFNIDTHISSWNRVQDPVELDLGIACMLEIQQNGTPYGTLITDFSFDMVVKVLKELGVPNIDDPTMLGDTIEEITNMIYGMVKSILNSKGYNFEVSFPAALNKEHAPSPPNTTNEKIVVSFLADGHQCQLIVTLNTPEEI